MLLSLWQFYFYLLLLEYIDPSNIRLLWAAVFVFWDMEGVLSMRRALFPEIRGAAHAFIAPWNSILRLGNNRCKGLNTNLGFSKRPDLPPLQQKDDDSRSMRLNADFFQIHFHIIRSSCCTGKKKREWKKKNNSILRFVILLHFLLLLKLYIGVWIVLWRNFKYEANKNKRVQIRIILTETRINERGFRCKFKMHLDPTQRRLRTSRN